MSKAVFVKLILSLFIISTLAACGGGGSDPAPAPAPTPTPTPAPETASINGGGVKGPLANAVVTVYAFDGSKAGFKGAVVAAAATDANAAITGLALPVPVTPPYIMEFTSTPGTTTDITTGLFPVITTLRTVITQSLIDAGQQIYATPLTTMAVDIAVSNAVDTNGTAGIQSGEFEAALTAASSQVVSTLGFGLDSSVDIFDTPPLVDNTTVSAEQQAQVAAYRSAVEAVTAIAFIINEQSSGADTDSVLAELAADLADGGGIDGSAGTLIDANTLQVLEQDPATLPIPNSPTNQTVADVQAILVTEAAVTAPTTAVTELDAGGSITTQTAPAETNPDSDGDGVFNADDAFPEDAGETVDSDGDGLGDNADPDDDNNGILDEDEGTTPVVTATDTDGDGVEDLFPDNCINTVNPNQTNTDADAEGDACDADDDNDGTDDTTDAFPLDASETTDTDSDGLGDAIADDDDDNDGVLDVDDTGVSPIDGTTPCAVLIDCDGDGVFDGADFNPIDDSITFNFAPVVVDDAVTVAEDAAAISIAVTVNDTDDDGNPADTVDLSAIGANDTLLGTAVINGNNIDYTPVADASGVDTFSYTVTDGTVSSTGSVTVTITAVNDVPSITQVSPVAVVMDEDGAPAAFVAPTIDAIDADGDTLSWSLSSAATAGAATVSGIGASPTISYVPNANVSGTDSFDATVSDGNGGSAVITIDITVNAQNDAPVIAQAGPLAVVMDEDSSPVAFVAPVISATDIDSVSLTWTGTAANDGVATVTGTGASPTITYLPDADFNGADTFDVIVSDGDVSTQITVDVSISAQNDVPVVSAAGPFSIAEDVINTTLVGAVIATDVDGVVQNYNIVSGDTAGAFDISSTGDITVADTDLIDFESGITSYNLFIKATDGIEASDGVVVVVDIIDVNDAAPVIDAAGPFSIAEDIANATTVATITAADIDSTVSNFSITAGDPDGAFSINAGGVVAVANTSFIDYESATSFNLTITATDGVNTSTGEVVTVNINDVNDTAPVVGAGQSFNVIETATNGAVVGIVSATDADTVGGITGFSITGTVFAISASGEITVADAATMVAGGSPFTVSVDATDGSNLSASENVTITVVSNAPPVIDQAGPIEVIMDEDEFPQAFVAPFISATDADSLDWSTPGAANGLAEVFGTGVTSPTLISYTPDPDFNGGDSFVVNVSDGTSTVGITINVTVNQVNDVPVAADDSDTTAEDTMLTTISVLTNDDDGGDGPAALSVSIADISSANGGVVVDNGDGTFDYTPPADFNGIDSFSYTVTDGADTASAFMSVDVTSVNDAPVAVDDSEITTVDMLITTANVLSNDTDVDNAANELSVSAADTTSVNAGTVVNIGDGTFTYTPASGFIGVDSFTYTVTDSSDTDTGTVTITVSPPGTSIAMSDLMGAANGGVAGLDSFDNGSGITQFEIWTDTYDSGTGAFNIIDAELNYATGVFENLPDDVADGFVLSGGNWVQAATINVTAFGTGAGQSMDVSVRDGVGTEIESVRISAQILDIGGERLDAHLNADWQANMLDPDLLFTAGSKLITQYQFESLIDAYFLFEDDWCETGDPARFATLGNNCNGINSSIDASGYATTLDQVISGAAWTDPGDGTTPPDAIFIASNDANNTALMVDLVTGGVANYYLVDWNNADPAQRVAAPVAGAWVRDTSVQSVDMIRFETPASFQPLFADDLDEGLNNLLAVQAGFVRQGDYSFAGNSSFDNASPLLNGIAKDQVVANFDAPVLPDVTDLLGTWVSDNTSGINGDPTVIHFFDGNYYESSGTCDFDGTAGMEYGTFTWDNTTGTVTATSQGSATQGLCGPAVGAANGNTMFVNGDVLTINTLSYGSFTYSRLKGAPNSLVGSWVFGDITVQGEGGLGGHALVTFLDDGTYMMSEDCTSDGVAGFEYGTYSWDRGASNELTGGFSINTNGGCGIELDITGPITTISTTTVTDDTLTLDFGGGDIAVLTRHSPAFTPVVAAIPFTGLAGTEHYMVFYEADAGLWVAEKMTFDIDGSTYTHTLPDGSGDPVGTVLNGSYELISGVLHITDGAYLDDFIMIMSVDASSGANRTCWVGADVGYDDLANCIPPGEEFMFNNLTDAQNFRAGLNTPAAFSGSAVDASVVFAEGGIFSFEIDNDELSYWTLQWDGASVTDEEHAFDPMAGSFVVNTQTTDIALTSSGWATVDYRFDTVTQMAVAATFQNVEGGDVLTEVDVTFNEMDITGQPLFNFVESVFPQFMDNGVYSAGAKAVEITFTENVTYRYISVWDASFCGGAYNGNCNTVRSQQIDQTVNIGELSGSSSVETDASFTGVDTTAIEIGYTNSSQALLAVFKADNTIEFWEVDWGVSSVAVQSAFAGSWNTTVVNTETLLEYTVPAELRATYDFQFNQDETDGGFMSVQNGYLRNGEAESMAGDTGTFVLLNPVAAQDVINSIE